MATETWIAIISAGASLGGAAFAYWRERRIKEFDHLLSMMREKDVQQREVALRVAEQRWMDMLRSATAGLTTANAVIADITHILIDWDVANERHANAGKPVSGGDLEKLRDAALRALRASQTAGIVVPPDLVEPLAQALSSVRGVILQLSRASDEVVKTGSISKETQTAVHEAFEASRKSNAEWSRARQEWFASSWTQLERRVDPGAAAG